MKTTIKLLAASLIVLLAACGKEMGIPVSAISQTISLSKAEAAADPAANPMNPYDSIGRLHNIILDSLRRHVKATRDTTKENMSKYLSAYFLHHYGKPVKPMYFQNEKQICLDYKAVLLTQPVSKTAQGFFIELSQTLDGIKDLGHYQDYKEGIEATESKILAAKLPAVESANLLMTASVLRYSGYYWMENFSNGGVQQMEPDGLIRKIIGVIAGIGADATTIAYSYTLDPFNIVNNTVMMSIICGYYTGWW